MSVGRRLGRGVLGWTVGLGVAVLLVGPLSAAGAGSLGRASASGDPVGLGASAAIYGSTAVVGAPGTNSRRGAAYVFVHVGGKWHEQAKLTVRHANPACPENHLARAGRSLACSPGGERFGASVAIYGSTVVVGAPGRNGDRGAAYVFTRKGSSWSQQARLTAQHAVGLDEFGFSVGIFNSTVVVGVPGESSHATGQGAAYVFARSGTSWSQQAELTAADGSAGGDFGFSVAVHRATVVVGAPDKNSFTGAAYVFVRSGNAWSPQAVLTASDAAPLDDFGSSVAVYGSTAVAGAPAKGSDRGAAYIFARSGTAWSQQARLTCGPGTHAKHIFVFGSSVAIYRSTAVVGAEHKDAGRGAAYVFRRSGSSWSRQAALTAKHRTPGDQFGASTAIYRSTAVVGAPGTDSGHGAAYAFLRSGTTWRHQAKLTGAPHHPNP